jgi:hypothetical protein
MIPACTAAHRATASSGFTPEFGFLPKNASTLEYTNGILVEPHTNKIWSNSLAFSPASSSTLLHGSKLFSTKSQINSSNLALEIVIIKFFGPLESTVI